jgi:uncharacterized protein
MEPQRIIFISVISITTFALSLLTARIYALGLKSGTTGVRIATTIGALFPLIFIGANILGRYSNSALARFITVASDTLGGLGLYALITSIILGIILLVGILAHQEIPKNVSIVFLVIAGVLSITGLIQARMMKVVEYTVFLENAPQSWNGKRAALVSDTHFGMTNHKRFSDKVVKKIEELAPDFVLHAGDFYDGPKNNTSLITESWRNLTQKTPVFYAPGNHEEYGPYGTFIQSVRDAGVTVLENTATTYDGVQIAGITYFAKSQPKEAQKKLEALSLDTTLPLILINHPPTFHTEAEKVGADLMVSGHTHKGQLWPINFIVRMIYGKFFYGQSSYGSLSTVTTSGVGTAGVPMRLFNTPEIVVLHFISK